MSKYAEDTVCEWLIIAPAKYIALQFGDEFHTECLYDYVTVHDGSKEVSLWETGLG